MSENTIVKTQETPAQISLEAWHTHVYYHPQRNNPGFYADMIRGMNQVLAVLAQRLHEGYEEFTPASMRRFRRAISSSRKVLSLAIVFKRRHYNWDYSFQPNEYTQEALNLGRKIVLIELRLLAEKNAIEDRFRLFNHTAALRRNSEYWVYSVAGCGGGVSRQQIERAFEDSVFR